MTTAADGDQDERLAALAERYADKAGWRTEYDDPQLGYSASITLEWHCVVVFGDDRTWTWRIWPAGRMAVDSRRTFEAEDDAKFDALQELIRLVRSTPAAEARSLSDALTACRMAMVGLPVEHKCTVYNALRAELAADEGPSP
jgi:hypothetical protein